MHTTTTAAPKLAKGVWPPAAKGAPATKTAAPAKAAATKAPAANAPAKKSPAAKKTAAAARKG